MAHGFTPICIAWKAMQATRLIGIAAQEGQCAKTRSKESGKQSPKRCLLKADHLAIPNYPIG